MKKLLSLLLIFASVSNVSAFALSEEESVTNFRGGETKITGASIGSAGNVTGSLKELASFKTGFSKNAVAGGGGQGWTGQSLLLTWEQDETKDWTSLYEAYRGKAFTELVSASLDGKVYFHDFKTFKETRKPLNTGNPLKGTPSTDGKVLFVGEGLAEGSKQGFGIYDLRTMKKIYRLAEGNWSANDSSALFYDGFLFVASENGTLYRLSPKNKDFRNGVASVSKFKIEGGAENSVTAYDGSIYIATNTGKFYSINSKTFKQNYKITLGDDTDATMVINVEGDKPYGYIGTEVDKYLKSARFFKLDLKTGKTVWKTEYACYRVKDSDGGFLATPLLDPESGVVYISPSKYKGNTAGYLLGLDIKTGKELYSTKLSQYSWSSPVFINTDKGKLILHFDRAGLATTYDLKLKKVSNLKTGLGKIECSPVVKDKYVVSGGRGGVIKKFEIK